MNKPLSTQQMSKPSLFSTHLSSLEDPQTKLQTKPKTSLKGKPNLDIKTDMKPTLQALALAKGILNFA